MRPVGEARRLVDLVAGDAVDELVVAHLVAVAAHHRRDLRVEERLRDGAGLLHEDLDVLTRGVEDLDDALVRHQGDRKAARSMPVGERIDDRGFSGPAIWIRQSCAQNVLSRMNSVSTVTKGALASRSQKAESAVVSVMMGCRDVHVHAGPIANAGLSPQNILVVAFHRGRP